TERRSVESKREITGLVLCKAERPTACHLQAGSSDVNTFSRQSAAICAGDDGYGIDGTPRIMDESKKSRSEPSRGMLPNNTFASKRPLRSDVGIRASIAARSTRRKSPWS